ncbi:sigma-54-dependent Fis family transcriptional regulator [Ralstonia pseudosolanacearum]|uniref:sigma-54-dependent Fis family transcriptional regulator n=1 Tax=Ralstonia pseudosolanacearum TaxID=1310165 RepID=UPI001FF8E3C9|nr:sigma-54-dependent Fis family transcriptional regulator [Ralstonia pseudosolanacearum]
MQDHRMSHHTGQVLTLAQHDVPVSGPLSGPAADPSIARSWLRCLHQHGLDPANASAPAVLEAARIRERREQLQPMLRIADGEMHSLHRQLAGNGHVVVLTDADGVILDCIADHAERALFRQAGLWSGADWSEAREGTNGIGTCAVERQALTIYQDEHFRSRHIRLSCSASPVFDPQGNLLAVLDVSSIPRELSRQGQFHTTALVNLSAKVIEGGYFLQHFERDWLLRFHAQPEYVGLFSEGLLAVGGDGRIRAANQSALNLLGRTRQSLLGQPVETVFDLTADALLARATDSGGVAWPLHTHQGRLLFGLLRAPRPRPAADTAQASPPMPAAPGLCLQADGLRTDFHRALRVFEHDVPLLLHGETGTGKEAFARAVHQASRRAAQPFVAVNCAAIPETLIESELFGYRGGSFTGARREGMRGKLQQADGGTLFLDEIGDMPLALQSRLLRVLEERAVVPIGGEAQTVDARIVSASHRDMEARVRDGRFREDLYYRLNGLRITLPPLRERADQAALLAHVLAEESRSRSVRLDDDARDALLAQPWPGNVRQLRNVLRTLVALSDDGRIRLRDLPPELRPPAVASAAAPAPLDSAEKAALLAALQAQQWRMTHAAEALGISRNTLYRKLRKHGIARSGG